MSTTTRKSSTKQTAPKAAPAKTKKIDQREEDRDWTYLADKVPTDLHVDMAAFIAEKVGLEISEDQMDDFVKAVQCTAVLRMVYQRSDRNKKRAAYRALPQEVVGQRSIHMVQANVDAKSAIAARLAKEEAAKAARKTAAAARRASKKTAPAEQTA